MISSIIIAFGDMPLQCAAGLFCPAPKPLFFPLREHCCECLVLWCCEYKTCSVIYNLSALVALLVTNLCCASLDCQQLQRYCLVRLVAVFSKFLLVFYCSCVEIMEISVGLKGVLTRFCDIVRGTFLFFFLL